ncbi:hepatitis A virus cellular receptor 1 isoform X1 [Triplophysa dalaica]|uniref:hepatitis A virus cellular receptor 1 isoform X1 n=1 Tax=Triplophysa dalaica TaxID=1582913 RepID=UPI0024E00F52|nr:hepatitis A virus cellular receptor 1 isoform X1 [Triplophysa dalaica]
MTDLHRWIFASWLIFYLSMCKCDVLVQYFEGERATLPCKYDSRYHGKCHICWMKGDIPKMGCGDEIIASDGYKVVRRTSHRYQLTGDIPHGDVSLTISNIQKKDSGKYGCRIHVPGWFNDETYNVNLIVKDAPTPTTQETVSVPSITSERQTTVFTSDMTEATVSTTPEPVAVTTIPGSVTTFPGAITTIPGAITTIPGAITTIPGSITTIPGSITTESKSTHTATDIHTTKESSTIFGSSESSTTALWPSNTTHDNVVDYHEQSLVVNKKSVNTSAIIVPVLLLLLGVIVIAVILTWKQKRKSRAVAEIAQNSENAVIYNNSGSTVGLYSREMAVNNIYQIEPETEYEQWH